MRKNKKVKNVDFEKNVMAKVKTNQIVMKPKWYFILGSSLMAISFVGISIGAIFLTNIAMFLLRKHGPMGEWKLQLMLESFPWWVVILALIGMILGIWILKKYDFSYKKNYLFIVLGFIASIFVAAFLLDYSGINDTWMRQGPMRKFYQQIDSTNSNFPRGQGWRQNKQSQ